MPAKGSSVEDAIKIQSSVNTEKEVINMIVGL